MKAVISYAMDGANVANVIASELEKLNDSLKIEHYPTPGNSGNVSFWNLIITVYYTAFSVLCQAEIAVFSAF